MNVFEAAFNSWKMISRNKMRSFLTMLGIIIGVTAVIVVMSVGTSAQNLILNEVKSMGSNMISIIPGKAEENGPPSSVFGVVITTLKYEDGEALSERNYPSIIALSSYVKGNDRVVWEDKKTDINFYGVSSSYPDVEEAEVEKGRFFTKEEEMSRAKLVVLGSKVADDLFGDQNPLGERIKIKKSNFTIIGVMKERGGGLTQNQDQEIMVPVKTAQNILLGIDYVSMIRFKVNDPKNIDATIGYVEDFLRERHNIDDPKDDDFTVRSVQEALDALGTITTAIRFFLVAVSAISLIVGGFGIMNIMLATVEERVNEIGLRKAVGAKNFHITLQFLVETAAITFISGIIGIVLGVLISAMVASVAGFMGYKWDLIISFPSIIVASFVSIAVGLVFGLVPARKASRLNPIEALRYE
ncbi:MAG: ABC transporter permease [Candidatus Paceibacterota bacterium]|jgi:ABC-type antimicrobial peptide transport system permease subunit|nr:ABC transporter permease [Candidatus Paceibacterota bacterium]MDD5555109.1 ABC transporter permease [Candidatus Paceibacterota bacterium]